MIIKYLLPLAAIAGVIFVVFTVLAQNKPLVPAPPVAAPPPVAKAPDAAKSATVAQATPPVVRPTEPAAGLPTLPRTAAPTTPAPKIVAGAAATAGAARTAPASAGPAPAGPAPAGSAPTKPVVDTGARPRAKGVVLGSDWYIVKADDTLTGIAKRYYGKGHMYRRIMAANRTRIDDPDLIYEGMRLRIPNAEASRVDACQARLRQPVGRRLVDDGDADGDEFGCDQQHEGDHDAAPQVLAADRPHERRQTGQDAPMRRLLLQHLVFGGNRGGVGRRCHRFQLHVFVPDFAFTSTRLRPVASR